jgi:predicted peptidase
MSGIVVTLLIIIVILILMGILILPFWFSAPKISKDERFIKAVMEPGHRRYSVLLPEGYTGQQEIGLVIALHFGGHGTPYYGEIFLQEFICPALQELQAIIAAPDCPTKNWTLPESQNFILELIEYLLVQYKIDPGKILVTGYSIGGIGTWTMAWRYPERFSAAVAIAAQPPDDLVNEEWEVPLYVIQGRDDELFPIVNTTRVVVQLEQLGKDVTYRIVEKARHFEVLKYIGPMRDAVPWILNRWNGLDQGK